jgi:hypothetical protein
MLRRVADARASMHREDTARSWAFVFKMIGTGETARSAARRWVALYLCFSMNERVESDSLLFFVVLGLEAERRLIGSNSGLLVELIGEMPPGLLPAAMPLPNSYTWYNMLDPPDRHPRSRSPS